MLDFQMELSIGKECKLLNVSRNYFYYTRKSESQENCLIIELLKNQYLVTPFYGYRKVVIW